MDEWLPALREVCEALRQEDFNPVVVGGRALLLLRPQPSSSGLGDNLGLQLSVVERPTQDLDVALIGSRTRLNAAHDLLTGRLSFRWDGMKPQRYTRGAGTAEVSVDLLTAQRPPDRDEGWPLHWVLPIVAELPPIEIAGLHVMHPAGLVVLKGLASQADTRRRSRDYVDLAQLALRDRDGAARTALLSLIPRLLRSPKARESIRALRKVRAAFADEDSEGTIIASRALLAGALLQAVDDGGLTARRLVSAAMRQLLETVPG